MIDLETTYSIANYSYIAKVNFNLSCFVIRYKISVIIVCSPLSKSDHIWRWQHCCLKSSSVILFGHHNFYYPSIYLCSAFLFGHYYFYYLSIHLCLVFLFGHCNFYYPSIYLCSVFLFRHFNFYYPSIFSNSLWTW